MKFRRDPPGDFGAGGTGRIACQARSCEAAIAPRCALRRERRGAAAAARRGSGGEAAGMCYGPPPSGVGKQGGGRGMGGKSESDSRPPESSDEIVKLHCVTNVFTQIQTYCDT